MSQPKHNGPDRREVARYLFYLATTGLVVLFPPIRDRPIKTFAKPDIRPPFTVGVDFTSYDQYAWVKGERLEAVLHWKSNTTRSDIDRWMKSTFANAMTFMPYVGELGDSDGANLEKVLAKGKSYITDLSTDFKPQPSTLRRDLVVRISLYEGDYPLKAKREANERVKADKISGDVVDFFLNAAIRDMVFSNADKKPQDRVLSLELDAYHALPVALYSQKNISTEPPLNPDEYRRRLDRALQILSDHHSDMALVTGINDVTLFDQGKPNPKAKEYLSNSRDVMITITPDWNRERRRFSGLEDKIDYARQIIGDKKLYVRLQLGQYSSAALPTDFKMKWIESNELEDAMRIIKTKAQGSFLEDPNGLLLYRGLLNATAVDNGYLQGTMQRLHKEFLGIKPG